jgi:hypothetical protein
MRIIRSLATLSALVALTTGCASSGAGGSSSGGSRDLLTREEIQQSGAGTLYDAIQRERPTWLRARGPITGQGQDGIHVIMDGVRVGDVNFLQSARVDNVLEVRFINARDATTRWGTGFSSGAIEIRTR